jgi:HSP20 family molecular chaperone IbpA
MFFTKPTFKNHDTSVSQQRESAPNRTRPTRIPATDISETEDHFVLEIPLPGVVPTRVQMTVNDHLLTIHGPLSESALNPPNQLQ